MRRRAFTLVELLVVVAVIAMLVAILLPSLAAARAQGRRVQCGSNLRQLGVGLYMYANEHRGAAMPLAYTENTQIAISTQVYWWGTNDLNRVDHTRGFLWPYLSSDLKAAGLYECAEQPSDSYDVRQGDAHAITSTYGYNGYYLSPGQTPGWSMSISRRPWQRIETVRDPQRVFAFADSMIDLGGELRNVALLDPPWIYSGSSWTANLSPTTAFRHQMRANALTVDGHVEPYGLEGGILRSSRMRLGSVGAKNDPHYVPDWRNW